MPRADILIESPIKSSFRVEQVRGMFDVPSAGSVKHEWHVELPIEDTDWQIGLIVGPSGSGKTTIGRRLFPEAHFHEGYDWPAEAALVDAFPAELGGAEITAALSSVGFSSPPHWLKRYAHLSNGQKFRCELARVMLENAGTVVFDEFTSVVDRDAAKVSSAAVAKALRRRKSPRLVALSCHYDIVDWLDPDWVYDVASGEFTRRLLRRRPPIELQIHAVKHTAWKAFSGHHYLSASASKAGSFFVATWNDKPVAITSYVNLVHSIVKNTKREHRTVVLPDFQGVGIGNALSEWLGEYVTANGYRFRSVTSHPAMIRHREKSPKWKLTRIGHVAPPNLNARPSKNSGAQRSCMKVSCSRVTAGFEYVGQETSEPETALLSHDTETGESPVASRVASTAGRLHRVGSILRKRAGNRQRRRRR
jgi:GNAT superfamily N-acetyltransferase